MLSIEGKPSKNLFIINPEELLKNSESSIWERLLSTFGKVEVERFVARQICLISADAVIKQTVQKREENFKSCKGYFADVSEMSDITVHYYNKDGTESTLEPEKFVETFINLPIFEKIEERENTIFLKFI